MSYWKVMIEAVLEADTRAEAKEQAEALVRHIYQTGNDADLICPERLTVQDDVELANG